MGSRKAVLSVPRTLDMVPLGEILQGRSNQGDKAYSDTSDRYNSDSGILKGVLPPNWKKAWSSGEPTHASLVERYVRSRSQVHPEVTSDFSR